MKQSSHVDLVFKLLGSAWCVKLWHPTHTYKFNDSDLDLIPSLSSNTTMKCIDFHKIRKYQLTLTLRCFLFCLPWPWFCFRHNNQHNTSYIHHHYRNPTVFLSHLDFSKSVVEPRVCPIFFEKLHCHVPHWAASTWWPWEYCCGPACCYVQLPRVT